MITEIPSTMQQEAAFATPPVVMPVIEVHRPNLVSILEFVVVTELYKTITFKALMGRRPDPILSPGKMMIPNEVMAGSMIQAAETAIRYMYMYNYGPLHDILSDIDPDTAIENLRQEIEDGCSNLSASYRLVRDTEITEDRKDICERLHREAAHTFAQAIRYRLELAPPLPVSGVTGDDFELTTRVYEEVEERPDEVAYEQIRTEVQEIDHYREQNL